MNDNTEVYEITDVPYCYELVCDMKRWIVI